MNGVELIAAERRRQVEEKGWSAEHDQTHTDGELVMVAAELALDGTDISIDMTKYFDGPDPWEILMKHGHLGFAPDEVRNLTIAGALIAAEIDRVSPVEAPSQTMDCRCPKCGDGHQKQAEAPAQREES